MKIRKRLMCLLTAAAILATGTAAVACGNKTNGGNDTPPVEWNTPAFEVNPGEKPTVDLPEKKVTETKLTVYEGPKLLQSSSKVQAKVDNTDLFVYDTRVNHGRQFTYTYSNAFNQVVIFDFEGKVHMSVTVPDASELTDVVVRPLSYGVQTTVSGNTVEFDLEYSANYVLEYNDGSAETPTSETAANNALHIFANPIEENPITHGDENTIYVGPGVYSAGAIPLESGKTLYLAGGAYVFGQIRADGLHDITIRGRGIIDGEIYDRKSASQYTLPIELQYCERVKIEGISILDPAGWAVTLYHCNNVDIDNLKIITARANGDGISVQSCSNVFVRDGFVRTWDDSLVVKNTDRGNTYNVQFDNVVVWTDLAQSMEVGFETNGSIMQDIMFKNITVVHNYHKAAMSIHNSDDAAIKNVAYQSITIEDAQMLGDNRGDGEDDYLIDITIAYNVEWSKSEDVRGTVQDVYFDNIKVIDMADSIVCRINGDNKNNQVSNVLIHGVEIEGTNITSAEALKVRANGYTNGITVGGVSYDVFGAGVTLPYTAELTGATVNKTVVPTVDQKGLEVPDFAILDIAETYMGVPLNLDGVTASVTHGVGNASADPYDDNSGNYATAEQPITNVFDGDRSTSFVARPWTGDRNEFIAVTIDFGKTLEAGQASVIRIYLPEGSEFVYDYNVSVHNKKVSSKGEISYPRTASANKYTMTPATGNYFDIRLSSTLAPSALQLRFFRVDGMTGQSPLTISEIVIYPTSLSTNKPIIASTPNYDVYKASNLTDGNATTYWETSVADCNGAFFVVDLGSECTVKYIVMSLPPLLTWESRVQSIEIQYSNDGVNFTTLVPEAEYLFDSTIGNSVSLEIEPTQARYIKLVWSRSSSRYGAQLSELLVYGE